MSLNDTTCSVCMYIYTVLYYIPIHVLITNILDEK